MIYNVTGHIGSGKTTFGMTIPGVTGYGDIGYLNFDVKPYHNQEKFGFHRSFMSLLASPEKGADIAFANAAIEAFNDIPSGLHVIIIDSWAQLTKNLFPLIMQEPARFKSHWYGMNQFFRNMETFGVAKRLESGLIDYLQTKARNIVIADQLADEFDPESKKPTGRLVPLTSRPTLQAAEMRLFLVKHPDDEPCPAAVVLKQPAITIFNPEKGRLEARGVLPNKLVPKRQPDGTISLWDCIEYYYENPASPDDVPLTVRDKALVAVALEQQNEVDKTGVPNYPENIAEFIRENKSMPAALLVKKIAASFEGFVVDVKELAEYIELL